MCTKVQGDEKNVEEIIEQLKHEASKDFISVEFRNGHFHTVKAFGIWNCWVGSEADDLKNQTEYIKFVEENEHTDVYDILVSNNEDDAKEIGIVDDEGGFI